MLKLLLLLAVLAMSTWSVRIIPKTIECRVHDPNFTRVNVCSLKAISRTAKVINVGIKLLKVPVTNITVGVELFRCGYNRPALFACTIDGCRFLDAKRRNSVANFVYNFLSFPDHSNMNHSCPFDHDLILKDARFDKSVRLPLFLNSGDYKLVTKWYAYSVLRATVELVLESL